LELFVAMLPLLRFIKFSFVYICLLKACLVDDATIIQLYAVGISLIFKLSCFV
jgi:hypothetical protein